MPVVTTGGGPGMAPVPIGLGVGREPGIGGGSALEEALFANGEGERPRRGGALGTATCLEEGSHCVPSARADKGTEVARTLDRPRRGVSGFSVVVRRAQRRPKPEG